MISLTNSQAKIIQKLMKFEKENDEKGISTAFLGKRGINRRTFEINQDFMLQNYLIKIQHYRLLVEKSVIKFGGRNPAMNNVI